VPRETPRGPANDATENTRKRDDGRAARTAASTPDAHPTSTDEEEEAEEARTDRHADREAGATEREPENPTTGDDERAATTEEGKSDREGAMTGSPPQTPGARGGAGKQIRLRMICFSALPRPGCINRSRQRSRRRLAHHLEKEAARGKRRRRLRRKTKSRVAPKRQKNFFGAPSRFRPLMRRKNCFGGAGSAALDFVLAARVVLPRRAGSTLARAPA